MPDQLTAREAAELLGVTPKTIDRLSKAGHLTKHKSLVGRGIGGTRVWFERAQVEALQTDRLERTPEPAPTAKRPKRKK